MKRTNPMIRRTSTADRPGTHAGSNPLLRGFAALAGRLVNDKREHLTVFSYVDDLESYIADHYRFTLLHVNEEGTAAHHDIRRATGGEERRQEGTGSLPAG